MQIYIKAIAGVLISLVLILLLEKQEKYIGMLLALLISCFLISSCVQFFQPVISFIQRLRIAGHLNSDLYTIIFKAVGIGLLGEITTLICVDTGNAAIGKALQFLTTGMILWLSLPLFTALIELIEKILVDI